jgi:murein L,D-transpeptidase YcbB/YkuD
MDAWRRESPFWGVGVYLGGVATTCDRDNLTSAWVDRQTGRGWRVLPIWVGPQAACSTVGYAADIDSDRTGSYAAAARQGRRNAWQAVQAARAVGIAEDSTLWYDVEDFEVSRRHCRRSTLTFLSAWTERLHSLGYTSGVYSNVTAAVHALDYAETVSPRAYAMPDQVWYAWDNGRANTAIKPEWVREQSWAPHARIHQYALDEHVAYGGVELKVDRNFMDVGRGSVAPRERLLCGGVRIDFAGYRRIHRGSSGAQVKAAQCLLERKNFYDRRVHGRYDVATTRAVRRFQSDHGLRVSGAMTAPTWTVMLAEGRSVLLKRGSVGSAVRRLQRGLTAALDTAVPVTGVLDRRTTGAVRRYQTARGLLGNGIVGPDTWAELKAGHR